MFFFFSEPAAHRRSHGRWPVVAMFVVAAAIGVVFGRYSATKSPTSIRLRQLRYEEHLEQLHGVDLNQKRNCAPFPTVRGHLSVGAREMHSAGHESEGLTWINVPCPDSGSH